MDVVAEVNNLKVDLLVLSAWMFESAMPVISDARNATNTAVIGSRMSFVSFR